MQHYANVFHYLYCCKCLWCVDIPIVVSLTIYFIKLSILHVSLWRCKILKTCIYVSNSQSIIIPFLNPATPPPQIYKKPTNLG